MGAAYWAERIPRDTLVVAPGSELQSAVTVEHDDVCDAAPETMVEALPQVTVKSCAASVQLEEDFVKANPEWVKELEIMVATKVYRADPSSSSCPHTYPSL